MTDAQAANGHTALPWREWHGDIVADGDALSDYDDYVIAGIGTSYGSRSSVYCPVKAHKPEGKANAALIVERVNKGPAADAMAENVDDLISFIDAHVPILVDNPYIEDLRKNLTAYRGEA